jgi:hypothetical protein
MKPGGIQIKNVEDPIYQASIKDWAGKRTNWIMIQSLRATPGLEWDSVKYDDPNTWANWETELQKVFTAPEISRIMDAITAANGLNEARIERARQSFLLLQAVRKNGSSFLNEGQPNMPSGEPAKDSESRPQESATVPGTN